MEAWPWLGSYVLSIKSNVTLNYRILMNFRNRLQIYKHAVKLILYRLGDNTQLCHGRW